MSPLDWVVIAAGAAAIFAVNWWFFIAGRERIVPPARSNATDD